MGRGKTFLRDWPGQGRMRRSMLICKCWLDCIQSTDRIAASQERRMDKCVDRVRDCSVIDSCCECLVLVVSEVVVGVRVVSIG